VASANEVYNTAAVAPQQYKVVAVQQPQHFVAQQQHQHFAVQQQPQHFAAQQVAAIRAPVVAYEQRPQFVVEPQHRFPVDNRRFGHPSDLQQYRPNAGGVHFSSYFLKGADLYNNERANQAVIAPQVVPQYADVRRVVAEPQVVSQYAQVRRVVAEPQVVAQYAAARRVVAEPQVYGQVAAHIQPQQFAAKYQRTYEEPKIDNYSAQDLVAN